MTIVSASPLISPLSPIPDATGNILQKRMIWVNSTAPLSSQFVAFRHSLIFNTTLRSAKLDLFADVRYLLWINGTYVLRGPARFEPGGPEYDTLDVTQYLHKDSNSIVVLVLGDCSNGKMRHHAPGIAVRLVADGRVALTTDETWRWSDQTRYRTPVVDWGNVFDQIDARVEDGDWTQPDYDDHSWATTSKVDGSLWGPLSARRIPLLRETPVVPVFNQQLPVTLTTNQKLTFTTSKLIQAYTVLDIDAEAGSEISLDYAHIAYIARAGHQTYISSDTHGLFGGTISVKSGSVTIRSVKLIERLYPFNVAGNFQSDDDQLNKLWTLCARSCQVFSEDSYVDCADRERTEWMDDDPPAFDITRTALSGTSDDGAVVYSDPRLLHELIRRTALTVQPDGWVKAHTCSDRFDIHAKMEDRSCDWIQGVRRYYDATGDSSSVAELWPVIVQQLNYFLARRSPRGLVRGREWEVWGNPVGYITCEGAGLNAFVYKALVDAAYLGRIIGRNDEAAQYDQDAIKLAAAFNNVLWDRQNNAYYSGYITPEDVASGDSHLRDMKLKINDNLIDATLFPALFALDQGIVPPERCPAVIKYLLANRSQTQRIMTFYYLFKQMYAQDSPALDTEVLQSLRTHWSKMIDWPWQTTWEDFEGGSKAHIYGMFPGYFLSAYVLGIRDDEPYTAKHIMIEPHLGDLKFAHGTVVTKYGLVPASWKIEDSKLVFSVTVPKGITATLRVPHSNGQTHLTLNGKPVAGRSEGSRIEINVKAGKHEGVVLLVPAKP